MKTATGEEVTAEGRRRRGQHHLLRLADHYALDDDDALVIGRLIFRPFLAQAIRHGTSAGLRAIGLAPGPARRDPPRRSTVVRRREVIAASSTAAIPRVQARYGETLVTACADHRLPGRHPRRQRHPLGRVRAQGRHFVELAATPDPLVFPRTSPAAWFAREYEAGGIAGDGAKLVAVVSTTNVPRSP